MDEINNIIIVGGGISGLYLLDLLQKKYSNLKIKLFERNAIVGGRIKTEYSNNNEINKKKTLFETGPWRIHETHTFLLKLIDSYKLEKEKLSISYKNSEISYTSYCNKKNNTDNGVSNINLKTLKNKKGLTERDKLLITKGICYVKDNENYSKTILNKDSKGILYGMNKITNKIENGIYDNDNNNVNQKKTDFNKNIKLPPSININTTNENYWIVKEGLSKIVNLLETQYKKFIFVNHRIVEIKRINEYYELNILYRNGNNFETKIEKCKYLFIAIPPKESAKWFIVNNYMQPLINSVDTIQLNHIYAYSKKIKSFKHNRFELFTDTEFSKTISGNYNNNWFQIGYNYGENAKFFYRLKQNYPHLYKKIIINKFKKMGFNIPITKIKMFYWENAVHYWKPSFEFDEEKSVNKSIYPDPINLPNCFYIGEAFSSIQGWIEGALETTNKAFNIFNSIKENNYMFKPMLLKKLPIKYEYVIVDNRVINVSKWKQVHPGSKKAIENHLFEDISLLFRHIPHTHNSWNILYNLQEYWVLNGKIGFFTNI